jgi:purine-nucleoside phosphorylase
MKDLYTQIQDAHDYIRRYTNIRPDVAIVLGTGLGHFSDNLTDSVTIAYSDIPHFPTSTVESHAGKLLIGKIGKSNVVVMAGRFHYYEGYSAREITFPIRVMEALGADQIILTNAAGGVNPHFCEGEIVCVTDHINMMPEHPLRGPNDDRLGLRFPDMLHVYDDQMRSKFDEISSALSIPIKHGVYLGWQGPTLETPAEYKLARILGADVLGMSTVPEVIVAHHAGMRICVFSIVSNVCYPASRQKVTTIENVIKVVNSSAHQLDKLLEHYLTSL